MPQCPAYLFWVSDWINDCSTMEFIDQMMYRSLIDISWLRPTCALPDDHEWIRRRLSQVGLINGKALTKKFYDDHVRPIISAHFPADEHGEFRNPKLSKVREKATRIAEKNALNISRRWESNAAISKAKRIRPNEFGNTIQSNPIQCTDSESGTATEYVPESSSPTHPGDGAKNWNDDSELRAAFEFGSTLCTHHARLVLADLEPWLRAGLDPADLRRAFERGIAWARQQPNLGPNFSPRDFRFFKRFFEGELIEKNARPKTNVVPLTPKKTPAEIEAEWRSDLEWQVEEIRKHVTWNNVVPERLPFVVSQYGFSEKARRLALERGIINLKTAQFDPMVRIEPECTILHRLTVQYRCEITQGDTIDQRAAYRQAHPNGEEEWVKPRLEAELAEYYAKCKQAPVLH